LLRRWTRVFFSSLRCFFLAMRLRRFLMTEPTGKPFACVARALLRPYGAQAGARATRTAYLPHRTVENRVVGVSPDGATDVAQKTASTTAVWP
jgi:hypothetical protein